MSTPLISKKYWQDLYSQVKKYVIYDLLRANDTPHKLALGCAIGMFVAITPTIPFQMMLTFAFSWLLRANKAVGLPVVWITNPATVVPIYLPLYLFGCKLLGIDAVDVDFGQLIADRGSLWLNAQYAWQFMQEIFWPLWLGSSVAALAFGGLTYWGARQAIIRYRIRRYGSLIPTEEERPST